MEKLLVNAVLWKTSCWVLLETHLNATQLCFKTKWCLNQEEQLFDVPLKDVSVTYYFKLVLEQVSKQNIKSIFTQHFNLVALSIYISKWGSKKTTLCLLWMSMSSGVGRKGTFLWQIINKKYSSMLYTIYIVSSNFPHVFRSLFQLVCFYPHVPCQTTITKEKKIISGYAEMA